MAAGVGAPILTCQLVVVQSAAVASVKLPTSREDRGQLAEIASSRDGWDENADAHTRPGIGRRAHLVLAEGVVRYVLGLCSTAMPHQAAVS